MTTTTKNTQLTDAELRNNVKDEIHYDSAAKVTDIVVVAEKGRITLEGLADSYGSRMAAVNAAWRVYGVTDVVDKIAVNPGLLGRPTDEEIAADLRRRIEKDFLIPKGRISVNVVDGIVTLTGTVNLHIERQAAKEEAKDTVGVRMVKNLIEINRSAASPAAITGDIHKALVRNARVDADSVQVTASGGTVTLTGSVHSFAERQEAEDAAWRAGGVTEVIDEIAITPV